MGRDRFCGEKVHSTPPGRINDETSHSGMWRNGLVSSPEVPGSGSQIVGAIDHNEEHLRGGFCETFEVEERYDNLDMISSFSNKADA